MENKKKNNTPKTNKAPTSANKPARRNGNGGDSRKKNQAAALSAALERTLAASAPSDALIKNTKRRTSAVKTEPSPAPQTNKRSQSAKNVEDTPKKEAAKPAIEKKEKIDKTEGKDVSASRKTARRRKTASTTPAVEKKTAKQDESATAKKNFSAATPTKTDAPTSEPASIPKIKRRQPRRKPVIEESSDLPTSAPIATNDNALKGTPLSESDDLLFVDAFADPAPKRKQGGYSKSRSATRKAMTARKKDVPAEEPVVAPLVVDSVEEQEAPVYEIDNSDLPDDLPLVQPFVLTPIDEVLGDALDPAKITDASPSTGKNRKSSASAPVSLSLPLAQELAPLHEESEILSAVTHLLEVCETPLSRDTLIKHIHVEPQSLLDGVLLKMLECGELFLSKKRKYALPTQLGYLTGRIQVTTRGFGFLIPNDESGDVFIAQKLLNGALNGDQVVVRIVDPGAASREGEVLAVREHVNERIIGTLEKVKGGYVVHSDNNKLVEEFFVEKGRLGGARQGQKVVADIDYSTGEPLLTVKEVLGYPDEDGTDVLSILRAHDISEEFSPHVLRAARNIAQEIARDDILRREDLRDWNIVTIDGADSRDFDDAISLDTLENGNILLGVHIADVVHYIRENGAIDKEAGRRATSVYLVDRVVPMLPSELSNGICSLNPDVDRLCISCFMEIDAKGRVVNHRIAETVIRSKERLVYEDVTALLEGDEEQRSRYAPLVPMLEKMEHTARLLGEARQKRGSIDFDLPESKIQVDAHGKPVKVGYVERGFANRLIEEFMLICNETIAQHMALLDLPMVYRVHEPPEIEKVHELNLFLGSLGYSVRHSQNGIRPKQLQAVLEKANGKPEEGVISRVMLRSLKKARYSDQNLGHFGLAADNYCHFTSPIRRYPDLEVHRILKDVLHGQLNEKRQEALRAMLPELCVHCSEKERDAMEAERDVDDLKKAEFLSDHIGETFDGIVSGVTSFGLFIMLPNTCEGMVRISDINDDYYSYDEKNYQIVGRHTKKCYRLGDSVRISVRSVNVAMRQVDFTLLAEKTPRGRRPRKPRKQA